MSIVNPNSLTSTRIPSAIISTTTSSLPGNSNKILRKISNAGVRSKIVIGPTDSYQYIKSENWRAGLTPYDDGYYNDGVSAGHGASDAPSRYYNSSSPSIFEWWSKYVIYCDGGSTTGPNGNDNLEIFVADDAASLVSLTNNLLGASTTDEASALAAIAASDTIICVNTHYPNIPINDSVGINGVTYSLKLLHDFGFIPSYPRGGTTSFDISNNAYHNMILTSTSNITYDPDTTSGLKCLGGCLKFSNDTSLDYAYIPYQSDLYSQNTTVSVWVRTHTLNANKCIIDTTNGWNSGPGAGYQLFISNNAVTLLVLTSGSFNVHTTDAIITADEWYNITFVISTDPGNSLTYVNLVVSNSTTYNIYSTSSGVVPGGQPVNTNDFVVGVKKTSPASNPVGSRIALVSVYDNALSDADIHNLWSAHALSTPRPASSLNGGRFGNY